MFVLGHCVHQELFQSAGILHPLNQTNSVKAAKVLLSAKITRGSDDSNQAQSQINSRNYS